MSTNAANRTTRDINHYPVGRRVTVTYTSGTKMGGFLSMGYTSGDSIIELRDVLVTDSKDRKLFRQLHASVSTHHSQGIVSIEP